MGKKAQAKVKANQPESAEYADGKALVSISQAASILNVSIDTVRRWDKNGTLKSSRPDGKNRFFAVKDLEAIKFSQPLTISEASEQLGVSVSTLRRLEKKGLIEPERNGNGERLYDKQALQTFLRSEYFVRQKGVEEEILKPLNGKPDPADAEAPIPKTGNDPAVHVLLGEHHLSIADLKRFKKMLTTVLATVAMGFALVVLIITVLFLLFPAGTSKMLGYYHSGKGGKQFSLEPQASLLARQARPFSGTALRLVEAVNPDLRKKIAPFQPIQDVNDVLAPDANGDIISKYTFSFPDTSYFKVPDQGLIINLNADFVHGKQPGLSAGDLAVLPITTNLIKDGAITREKLAPGLSLGGGSTTVVANSTPGSTTSSSGTITDVIASDGLQGGGNSGAVTLSVKLNPTASGLESNGSGLSLVRSCAANQILKWNGAGWICAAEAGGGSLIVQESDGSPSVSPTSTLQFTAGPFGVTDMGGGTARVGLVTQVNKGLESDANGVSLIDCTSGQILKYNGSNQWACAADATGGGGGSSVWSDLTDPTANLALNMNEFTTNFTWDTNNVTAGGFDGLTLGVKNDAATDTNTQRAVSIKNFDNGLVDNTGSGAPLRTEELLHVENLDDSRVNSAIKVVNSNALGVINVAFDASGTGINNALSVGDNKIIGGDAVIDFNNFDVSSIGTVTIAGGSAYTSTGATIVSSTGSNNLTLVSGTSGNQNLLVNPNQTVAATSILLGPSGGVSFQNSSGNLLLDANGANQVQIGGVSTGDVLLAGGVGAFGCTITNATGDLQCNGNITNTTDSGTMGFWTRSGNTLQPSTGGDNVQLTIGGGLIYSASSTGNFDQSTSSGTFKTGTGAVSLNGDTTLAANKNFTLASGIGVITQTYTGNATAASIIANSITGGTGLSISETSLQNGKGISITGGTAMTSGNLLQGSGTFNHTVGSEVGSLASLSFTDASTNANSGGVSAGVSVASTINTSGAGTKTIDGVNVAAPAITGAGTGCASGVCTWNGYAVTTSANSNANITQNGLNVQTTGSSSTGTINGINIGAISGAAATENGILIGAGWDLGITSTTNTDLTVKSNGTGILTLDSTGTGAVNLGTDSTNAKTVNLGSNTTTSNTTILAGASGTLNVDVNAGGVVTNIGTGTTTGAIAIGNTGNTTTIEGSSSATGIQIGNGATAHGIQIGSNNTAANAILLGANNSTSTLTLDAGTAAAGLQIGNSATAHGIQIGTSSSAAQALIIGSTNATSTLVLDSGTGTSGLQIGNTTGAHDIKIGNGGTATQTVTIGSTSSASAVTVHSGTAGILMDSTKTTGNAFQLTDTALSSNGARLAALNFTESLASSGNVSGLQITPTIAGTNAANTYNIFGLTLGSPLGSCPALATCNTIGLDVGGYSSAIGLEDATTVIQFELAGHGSELKINNAQNENDLSLKDLSTNFGSALTVGAAISRNSYFGDDFNSARPTGGNCTASTAQARGDWGTPSATCLLATGELSFNATTVGAGSSCTASSTGAVNGIERLDANTVAGTATASSCSETLGTNIPATPNNIYSAATLPVVVMKVRANTGAVGNRHYYAGMGDTAAITSVTQPTNGIFFSNCTGAGTPSCSANLSAVVISGGATASLISCGAFPTNTMMYLKIEVLTSTTVRFLVDTDTSNGIVESPCGGGTGIISTNVPSAAMSAFMAVSSAVSSPTNTTMDIDYFHSWQDDNISSSGLSGDQTATVTPAQAITPQDTTLATSKDGKFIVNDANGQPLLGVDQAGNATLKGKVAAAGLDIKAADGGTAASIDNAGNASFSGGVKAGSLAADQVVGADIGQQYFTNDSSLENGDVVMLDPSDLAKVKKADQPYVAGVVGVVTSAPAMLVEGSGAGSPVVVAAAGTVSVKVSTEGGAIKAGDPLTSSGQPGVAMKAGQGGAIIGRAVLDYGGDGVSSIPMVVGNGFAAEDFSSSIGQLTGRVDSLEQQVNGMQSSTPTASTTGLAAGGQDVSLASLAVDHLTVNMDMFVNGSMVVSGPAEFKGSTLFDDLVTFGGDTTFNGSVTFNNNSAGYAVIKPGENSIQVIFKQPFKTPPIVTISLGDGKFATYSYRNVTEQGFEIILPQAATDRLTFSWTAAAINNPQTYISAAP
jgi:excisionase family DNA binding protein